MTPRRSVAEKTARPPSAALLMLSAVLAVVLFMGLAAVVGGVGTYLVPVVVIIGVVVVLFWPLAWVASELDDRWYRLT